MFLNYLQQAEEVSTIARMTEKFTSPDVAMGQLTCKGETGWKVQLPADNQNGGLVTALRMESVYSQFSWHGEVFLVMGNIVETEILTRGHLGHVITLDRVDEVSERAAVADYLILLTEHSFHRMVRVNTLVFLFVTKARRVMEVLTQLLMEGKVSVQLFHTNLPDSDDSDDCEQPRTGTGRPEFTALAMRICSMGETAYTTAPCSLCSARSLPRS